MTTVVLVEPYCTGSHRQWAHDYRAASSLDVRVLALPGRFWKWRMHGGAVTLARRLRESGVRPDVVLATDMLDVAAFAGLARGTLAGVPIALYMHENQLTYPPAPIDPAWTSSRQRRAERRDEHYGFVNLTSMLAADGIAWNSAHNRDSFLAALPTFLGAFPDHRERGARAVVAGRSRILPVGLDLRGLESARPASRAPGPPRVLWNHRWEHDKDPATFFRALDVVAARGVEFEVIVLGESFGQAPPEFAMARERLGERIRHCGYVRDRAAYVRRLWEADVVVSTARHEFFGAAVVEAVACGCLPVLPNRLAYPELIPPGCRGGVLYDDFDGLVENLAAALVAPDEGRRAALQAAMAAYDWSVVAPRYDSYLTDLIAGGAVAAS